VVKAGSEPNGFKNLPAHIVGPNPPATRPKGDLEDSHVDPPPAPRWNTSARDWNVTPPGGTFDHMWHEKSTYTVTHVHYYENGIAYVNIRMTDNTFIRLRGTPSPRKISREE